jgi:hypothetical protein
VVASGRAILTSGTGSTTVVRTPNGNATALALDPVGDVAIAGWTSASQIYQANGHGVSISGLPQAEGVAISPEYRARRLLHDVAATRPFVRSVPGYTRDRGFALLWAQPEPCYTTPDDQSLAEGRQA